MSSLAVLMATLSLGVDYGWQPVAGGGIQYIIQLEPAALDALRDGQDLLSDLPPYLRNVKSYRITVGDGPLPHQGEPPPASLQGDPQPAKSPGIAMPGLEPLPSATTSLDSTLGLAPPRSFDPVPSSPLVVPTTGISSTTSTTSESPKSSHNEVQRIRIEDDDKPWMPFTLALIGLFVSLGANAYLSWMNVDLRAKYRTALAGWKR